MKLRPLKQEEKHIRKALLTDLQGKIRGLDLSTLKKQIEKLRSTAKPGAEMPVSEPTEPEGDAPDGYKESGPTDEEGFDTAEPVGLDPAGDEGDDVGGDDEEAEKVAAKEPAKRSLEDAIAALSKKSGGRGRG